MHDRRLERRLGREAKVAARAAARAVSAHAAAVERQEWVRRRARRRLPVQAAVAGGSTAGVVFLGFGDGWLVLAVGSGLLAMRSLARLTHRRPALPPPSFTPAAVPPPPPRGSAAWPALRRLEEARTSMARMLPLVAPAGRDAAEEAWRCAAANDTALRWQAARLGAVEPHRGAEPALTEPLWEGVAAQERLVAGLADLVAASADPHAALRLQDATEALHALAAGLREVSGGG